MGPFVLVRVLVVVVVVVVVIVVVIVVNVIVVVVVLVVVVLFLFWGARENTGNSFPNQLKLNWVCKSEWSLTKAEGFV